jgi:AraC-like DNA-binding protein
MDFILFASGTSIALFAGAQILTKDKKPLHYCMAIACFLLSYVLLYFWAEETGLTRRLPPALVSSDLSATFLCTPAFYLTSLTILHEGRRPVRRYSLYFVVPLAFAAGFGIFNGLTAGEYLRVHGSLPGHFGSPALSFLSLAISLSLSFAVLMDLLAARSLRRSGAVAHASSFGTQVVFLFFYLAASLVIVFSCIVRDEGIMAFGVAAIGLIAVGFTLTCTSILYFSEGDFPPAFRTAPPRPEWDRTSDELSARLAALMEKSAPYRDEKLSLPLLADMLGVEPKHLSYHLHTKLSVSFRGYINDWRLEAVCRDLLEQPERSILETAFESGFNSKSSFNTLFYQKYGVTPRLYRRSRLASPKA